MVNGTASGPRYAELPLLCMFMQADVGRDGTAGTDLWAITEPIEGC